MCRRLFIHLTLKTWTRAVRNLNQNNMSPDYTLTKRNRDDSSRSHAPSGYDQKREEKRQADKMIAIMSGVACTEMPMLRLPLIRRNSADIRHDPNRPKTAEDLERIEAAKRKQERKAARRQKFNSHNDGGDS